VLLICIVWITSCGAPPAASTAEPAAPTEAPAAPTEAPPAQPTAEPPTLETEPPQVTLPTCDELNDYLAGGLPSDPPQGIGPLKEALEKAGFADDELRERLGGFCARSEVIIVGAQEDIDKLASTAKVTLENSGDYDLDAEYICKSCMLHLYTVFAEDSNPIKDPYLLVGEVVKAAWELHDAKGLQVYADPNYLIQSVGGTLVELRPYHIGVSLSGTKTPATATAFDTQWAFGASPGIDLTAGLVSTGTGVPVYMFDASPLAPGQYSLSATNPNEKLLTVAPSTTQPLDCGGIEHGLFVAGLIHRVAPNSPITLYPVLDGCGKGTLVDLIAAIWQVFPKLPEAKQGAVLNLSLGVAYDPASYGLVPPDARDWLYIQLLQASLWWAHNSGAVVVAAAGNDAEPPNTPTPATTTAPPPVPMQIPASYPFAIGVAASNKTGGASCYSNLGKKGWWVMAPGGDGRDDPTQPCMPLAYQCVDAGCQYGVVSLVSMGPPPSYAYWSGTSFAAPLVSGLAAACLASNHTGSSPWKAGEASTKVWEAIRDGAGGPGNVINVPKTLENCK
jgi:hypothetical protein